MCVGNPCPVLLWGRGGGGGVASWVVRKLRVARGAPFQTTHAKIERVAKPLRIDFIYNALLMTRSVSSLTEKLEAVKKNTPDGRF